MFKTALTGMSILFLTAFLALVALATDMKADYFHSINTYFDANSKTINQLSNAGIADEELPVAFFIAHKANATPAEIANIRLEDKSWMEVCKKYSLDASSFYMIVTSPINSKTYAPIFDRFEQTPQKKWKAIELSDNEIINLVNLKMMASLHDYSAYEIMAMRDYGKSFLRINQQVTLAKIKLMKKQNQTVEAR